jgi:hypothetical protein
MKPDLYTKTVLTVIAGALLLLAVRSFQNPAPALAQTRSGQATQAVQRLPQHVIVDNPPAGPEHVIIDGIQHVIVDDMGASLSSHGLPVLLMDNDNLVPMLRKPVHVVVDDLDTRLSLQGLPVSLKSTVGANPSQPFVRWRYQVDQGKCNFAGLNQMSPLGWELFQFIMINNGTDLGCAVIYRQPM